jgi:hypothetical protein
MSDSSPSPADPATVEILRQLALPGARSLSPIDIARALAGEEAGEKWQKLLPAVRRAALALARDGRIEILRHGKPVDPAAPVRGVIRLRLPAGESHGA